MRSIYIEFEVLARDFLWRFRLSQLLADLGFQVFYGWRFRLAKYCLLTARPGDIFISKDLYRSRETVFSEMKAKGVYVIGMYEESLMVYGWPTAFLAYIGALRSANAVLTFSKYEKIVVKQVAGKINPKLLIFDVNHPRFINDYCEASINKCGVERYLVAFSETFNRTASDDRFKFKMMKEELSLYGLSFDSEDRHSRRDKEMLKSNRRLMRAVLRYKKIYRDVTICLRFHPSESRSWVKKVQAHLERKYIGITISCNTVPIADEFHDNPILMHTNCTTAIDAFFNKVRTISCFPLEPWDVHEANYQELWGVPARTEIEVHETMLKAHMIEPSYGRTDITKIFFGPPSYQSVLDAVLGICSPTQDFMAKITEHANKNRTSFTRLYVWLYRILGRTLHRLKVDYVYQRSLDLTKRKVSVEDCKRVSHIEIAGRSIIKLIRSR